jgi:hypothetical protein
VRPSSSNLIRSAERDSDGFLKLESLDFFETPSPTYSRRTPTRKKAGVEIRCHSLMISTRPNAFQHSLSTPLNAVQYAASTEVNESEMKNGDGKNHSA